MDLKKLTVSTLARQLSECNQAAEIAVTIGALPMSLPVSSIAIKENAANEEIVALNIDYDLFVQLLDLSEDMLQELNE